MRDVLTRIHAASTSHSKPSLLQRIDEIARALIKATACVNMKEIPTAVTAVGGVHIMTCFGAASHKPSHKTSQGFTPIPPRPL